MSAAKPGWFAEYPLSLGRAPLARLERAFTPERSAS